MTRYLPLAPLASLALLVGCADTAPEISASDELALTAVNGEEEDFEGAPTDFSSDEAPGRPPLFRMCDADGSFNDLRDRYDVDGDGEISDEEGQAVFEDRDDRDSRRWRARAAMWTVLSYVYDADMDGDFSEAERAVLHEDFDARCEVLHERILDAFDADADGELSEDEQAAAAEAIRAEREQRRESCNECRTGDGERPEDLDGRCSEGDGESMRGERPPMADAMRPIDGSVRGERPDPSERIIGHLVDVWDADGDGSLSLDEHAALNAALSERIRSGEPMRPRGREEAQVAAE